MVYINGQKRCTAEEHDQYELRSSCFIDTTDKGKLKKQIVNTKSNVNTN